MLNIRTAQDDIDEMFESIDENGDRLISFDEYASLMLGIGHTNSASELQVSFDKIDTGGDGWVSPAEFRAWCR